MTQASVGFHCPECVKGSGQRVLTARQLRIDPIATKVLIGLNAAVYVLAAATGGARGLGALPDSTLVNELLLIGAGAVREDGQLVVVGVAEGEWWRLVTGGFLHANLIHLGMNMLFLWILGSMLEPALGRARFVGLYVASLLAGSAGVMLMDPEAATVGASGAIFGLLGAAVVLQRSRGIDPWRSGLGTLVIVNLAFTFLVPGISVGGHLGGLIGGAATGVVVFALERRTSSPAAAVGVCAAFSVGYVALAVWAADSWADPILGTLAPLAPFLG